MMINKELSIILKKIILKGNYTEFISFINENNIPADSILFGKRESTCWPLIQVALSTSFTNANYKGKIQIASHLLKNGADINDLRPYGASVLYSYLLENYYLKDNAKFEVYALMLVYSLELVRNESIDLNATKRENDFGILDAALLVYEFHERKNQSEFIRISKQIVLELVNKGAKLQKELKEYSLLSQNLINSCINN